MCFASSALRVLGAKYVSNPGYKKRFTPILFTFHFSGGMVASSPVAKQKGCLTDALMGAFLFERVKAGKESIR